MKDDTIFLGQSIVYGGIAMAQTFEKIPLSKKSVKTAKKNSEGKFTFDMVIQSAVNLS